MAYETLLEDCFCHKPLLKLFGCFGTLSQRSHHSRIPLKQLTRLFSKTLGCYKTLFKQLNQYETLLDGVGVLDSPKNYNNTNRDSP